MDKHKLAACGIDCNECGQYKVTLYQDREAAENLVPWFRQIGWIGKCQGTKAVLKRAPLCRGCWSDVGFCMNGCGIRRCCIEKKINNCAECVDFPCEKCITFMTDGLEHHKKAMKYLLALKQSHN
jgi:hypothetical protein